MKYELTKDLMTGNQIIDSEHKELFDAVNKLLDSVYSGKGKDALDSATKFLLNYVDKHFKHEEELQQKSNYPGYTRHKSFHDDYKNKLKEIVSAIPNNPQTSDLAKLNIHVTTLVSHIKTEDKKLGEFLKAA